MYKIIGFTPQEAYFEVFQQLFKKINPEITLEAVSQNAFCYLALKEGQPYACLTFRRGEGMYGVEEACAIVGHYEALEEAAGLALLDHVKKEAQKQGLKAIIGPINGTTWERYRFVLPREPSDTAFDPPDFLGDLKNPPQYPQHFEKAGFSIFDRYESRLSDNLLYREKAAHKLQNKMDRLGIVVSRLDLSKYDEELQDIYHLSLQAFAHNRFYQPIDFVGFKALYAGIKPFLDADLILLARDKEKRLVGFVFGYPDLECLKVNKPPRLVFKTAAVAEELRASGLGIYLLDTLHLTGYRKGYRTIIHALMHSDNNSLKYSVKGFQSQIFKRYALYRWRG